MTCCSIAITWSFPAFRPDNSDCSSSSLLGLLDGHTASDGTVFICRSSSTCWLCFSRIHGAREKKVSSRQEKNGPWRADREDYMWSRIWTTFLQVIDFIVLLQRTCNARCPCTWLSIVHYQSFHPSHRFFWLRNGLTNPYSRTSILSLSIPSLAGERLAIFLFCVNIFETEISNSCLDRTRWSVGQRYCN